MVGIIDVGGLMTGMESGGALAAWALTGAASNRIGKMRFRSVMGSF
jgi:hypothetical protein